MSMISVRVKLLRELMLDLLDDDAGISTDAYNTLYSIVEESDDGPAFEDIHNSVRCQDGRISLPEDHDITA